MDKFKEGEDYCSASPDELFGVDFSQACYYHDREYRNEVDERKTRAQADADLRDDIIMIFKQEGKGLRGLLVGWVYWIAVRLFCKKFWV